MYSLLLVITILFLFLLVSIASTRRFLHLLRHNSLALASVPQLRPLGFRLLVLWIMLLDFINLWRNASRSGTFILGIALLVALSLFVLFVLILVRTAVLVFVLKW